MKFTQFIVIQHPQVHAIYCNLLAIILPARGRVTFIILFKSFKLIETFKGLHVRGNVNSGSIKITLGAPGDLVGWVADS